MGSVPYLMKNAFSFQYVTCCTPCSQMTILVNTKGTVGIAQACLNGSSVS